MESEDAIKSVEEAEGASELAVVKANAEYVRGLVAKRDRGTHPQAIEHFKKANELAGSVGQGPSPSRQECSWARPCWSLVRLRMLSRCSARWARSRRHCRTQSRSVQRSLLGQAHASLKNFEAAVQFGERALQLTRNLKMTQIEPVDLYNLGFFNLMLGRSKEAVKLFQESRKGADASSPAFQKELLYNLATALMRENDVAAAETTFKAVVGAAEATNDFQSSPARTNGWDSSLESVVTLRLPAMSLNAALAAANQGELKEAQEAIEKQLQSLT